MPAADPYVPGHGSRRFGVRSYTLELDYKVATNHLSGRAVLVVEALERLDQFGLDLYGLSVAKVKVDGRPPRRFVQRDRKLRITLPAAIAPGSRVSVEIDYAGKPRPLPSPFGGVGWEELSDGVLVASQPCGAPSWFPCNDRPDDKANYRFAVTVADGYRVIANGRLKGREKRAGRTTWRYEQPEPMSAYLAVLHVGRYTTTATGSVDLVHPRAVPVGVGTAFAQQAEMLRVFADLFGPYPFDRYCAVVTPDDLEIPLEAQTLSTFGANHAVAGWDNERLVAHELAHQWFGNKVTSGLLRDIWLHEGFACYTEWLWSEARGLLTADERAARHHKALPMQQQTTPLADPGMPAMFDDWVYKRGALTLHALRRLIGDAKFFPLVRDWTARYRHATVVTDDFTGLAANYSNVSLRPLWDAWLFSTPVPDL